MYCDDLIDKTELVYIINRLHEDTVEELTAYYGNSYKKELLNTLRNAKIKLMKLKKGGIPVAAFGVIDYGKSAGIFLLTTYELKKGNMITFLKFAKKQIEEWKKEYSLLMDTLYKKNKKIEKWLNVLGFKASSYQDKYFQIYYTGDIGLYGEAK